MCYIDADPLEVLSDHHPVARKRHRCHGCGGVIDKGEAYWRLTFVHEGEIATEKLCRPCDRDMRRFATEHGFGCFNPVGWFDFLVECVGEDNDPRWKMMLVRAEQRGKRAAA